MAGTRAYVLLPLACIGLILLVGFLVFAGLDVMKMGVAADSMEDMALELRSNGAHAMPDFDPVADDAEAMDEKVQQWESIEEEVMAIDG